MTDIDIDRQPISQVEWVDRDELSANGWNPNQMAKPERELLTTSLLEDGWTQPIVARPDRTIVDGYHRWTLSAKGPVRDMTGGMVPVVTLRDADEAQQRMSTVRHNRARGQHYVISMAEIVDQLVELGVEPEEIMRRLSMEHEEFIRLHERGVVERYGAEDFSRAWRPAFQSGEDPGWEGSETEGSDTTRA